MARHCLPPPHELVKVCTSGQEQVTTQKCDQKDPQEDCLSAQGVHWYQDTCYPPGKSHSEFPHHEDCHSSSANRLYHHLKLHFARTKVAPSHIQ